MIVSCALDQEGDHHILEPIAEATEIPEIDRVPQLAAYLQDSTPIREQ